MFIEPDDDEPVVQQPVATASSSGKKQKLINQFNFCERAALTYNNPSRVFIFTLLINHILKNFRLLLLYFMGTCPKL